MAFVYMLRCADGSYYVGSTRSLGKRIWEHQEGLGAAYTRRRRPVELVWHAEYPNIGEAFFWEKRIQSWSRAKREALIRGDYDALPGLAVKDFTPRRAERERRRAMPRPAARVKPVPPMEVVALVDAFVSAVNERRPGLIDSLYVHGSLCWGEYFTDSDIDFVTVLDHQPTSEDLRALDAAHQRVRKAFPHRRFEGFHCQRGDLARPPTELGPVPVHFDGAFDARGHSGVNLVTWHELAERGIELRGRLPTIYTDLDALLDFTRTNLDAYWAPLLRDMEARGAEDAGSDDGTVVWVTLGVARLHHVLARERLTSKSGAGRYVVEALDPRWHKLAAEALRIREGTGSESSYRVPAERAADLRQFLTWAIDDGRRLRPR